MIFENSHLSYWFFAVVFSIIGLIIGHKKRYKRLKLTVDSSLWGTMVPNLSYSRRFWKNSLWLLALFFIIVALLRPQYGVVFEQVERRGQDIYIGLDVSKSMLAQDVAPSRLIHAKREIQGLIDDLKGDRIGLIAFAGESIIQCPLTSDYAALKLFLDFIDPSIMPVPGTDIATAIKTARFSFKRVSKSNKPILILLSDGESFENDPLESARVAAKQNITIYTIGIGTKKGDPIPEMNEKNRLIGYKKDKNGDIVLSQLNESVLKQIASITGGRYFNSSLGAFMMDEVYKEIAYFEKKRLEDTLLTIHKDRYHWFLWAALICLLLATFLSDRKSIATGHDVGGSVS